MQIPTEPTGLALLALLAETVTLAARPALAARTPIVSAKFVSVTVAQKNRTYPVKIRGIVDSHPAARINR